MSDQPEADILTCYGEIIGCNIQSKVKVVELQYGTTGVRLRLELECLNAEADAHGDWKVPEVRGVIASVEKHDIPLYYRMRKG